MTKTEFKRLLIEIRKNSSVVSGILEQFGVQGIQDNERRMAQVEEHLNNIDGLSAQLREALTDPIGGWFE